MFLSHPVETKKDFDELVTVFYLLVFCHKSSSEHFHPCPFRLCVLVVWQQASEAGARHTVQAVCADGDLHVMKENSASVHAFAAVCLLQLGEPLEDLLVFTASLQASEVQDSNQVFPAAGGEEKQPLMVCS